MGRLCCRVWHWRALIAFEHHPQETLANLHTLTNTLLSTHTHICLKEKKKRSWKRRYPSTHTRDIICKWGGKNFVKFQMPFVRQFISLAGLWSARITPVKRNISIEDNWLGVFCLAFFFCFWCSWAFPRTRQLRLDLFYFFSETRSGLSHMVPFYYRMQQQEQRGHCHSHKVITQTGNRLIAHTKMHSTFNHLLVGFFFFSTLTFLFFLLLLFLPWWRDNLPPTVVSDDGSENTAGIITIIRQFLSLIRRCRRRLIRQARRKLPDLHWKKKKH